MINTPMGHVDYLASIFELSGKCVVDVGAGDGTFSQQIHDLGGKVTAIEIDREKVDAARANLPGAVSIVEGRGEELPLQSASQDLACFFFSFHHVPVAVQNLAIGEVRRVLRPGGKLHVVEPLAMGPMFDVVKLVEDETLVRNNSHQIMGVLGDGIAFGQIATKQYKLTRNYPDFDTLLDRLVQIDPARLANLPPVKSQMRNAFEQVASNADGSRDLEQPCIAYHFEML